MMRPLYEKARTSIEKVAAAQGFDYVLDSSPWRECNNGYW